MAAMRMALPAPVGATINWRRNCDQPACDALMQACWYVRRDVTIFWVRGFNEQLRFAAMNYPVLRTDVLVHRKSGAVGRATGMFYPSKRLAGGVRVQLRLKDGSVKDFGIIELRKPTEAERRWLPLT
jgi:hypothetical protein